jgi:flagellin-like protein
MKLNKAISPILATVILIAITLVIAIGVIGWIMGIWGSLGGPSESLVVVGGSATATCDATKQLTFTLSITNKGTAPAVIKRVEVLGISGTTTIGTGGTITVSGGTSTDIEVTVSGLQGCPDPGSTYQVNVYTAAGNVYSTVIKIISITPPSSSSS